ncbi:MAG: elongation factor P--(R)-beta-lysine ligase [Gammaproteobacteria bacterium]|nr:elongation factor P--(R)-beta-lysine ligase [Gammaproteobacteria bacterium]
MSTHWRPSASIDALKARSRIITQLRSFFNQRKILEVDTPLMCAAGTTDVYLDSMVITSSKNSDDDIRYLQTSPEFCMKRLLTAGIGDCYQICKAFRRDEIGKYHNPEFTLLEWYRINCDHHQLMDEMDALLQYILKSQPAKRISYRDLFLEYLGIDPHKLSIKQLIKVDPDVCKALNPLTDTKDDYLMLLLSQHIEPTLGLDRPCFIYDYPASQAALSKIRDKKYAERFEVYIHGVELANGFHELQQANEQLRRFQEDNKKRKILNKPTVQIDYALINALEHGLPNCAGVALGVDRLIMIALEKEKLSDVLSFSADNC